ncbi:MAG: formylglycine-generating enzyme family protein [Treponema sp.]|nr:formylglycine-generating enzyme family protein [Treponema sp.]
MKRILIIFTIITMAGLGTTCLLFPAASDSDVLNTNIPANFVRVRGGTFRMGTAEPKATVDDRVIRTGGLTMTSVITVGGEDRERPVRSVTVKSFNIAKYPVTQKEWFDVMGTTIRTQQNTNRPTVSGEGDNYPMYFVSWNDAIEYCNRRSIMEGLTPAYHISGRDVTCDWDANGYRLPTEAEWEYAARGGGRNPSEFLYSGSNKADEVAWFATPRSARSTSPVGSKAPNGLGIYDMSGNVWEWCWDWYADDYNYEGANIPNPRGSPSGTRRVLRGGSWSNSDWQARSAYRFYASPTSRDHNRGFRVVLP